MNWYKYVKNRLNQNGGFTMINLTNENKLEVEIRKLENEILKNPSKELLQRYKWFIELSLFRKIHSNQNAN